MTTIVRRIEFSAGHRLCQHEGKCAHLHGHNYTAYFHIEAEALDDVGRVLDFAAIKERIGGWIEANWDHGFVCYKEDHEAIRALQSISGQKLFLLDRNPTAENLARYLLEVVGPKQLAGTNARVTRVDLWETENCQANATLK